MESSNFRKIVSSGRSDETI
jgi:hypothetical protein